MNPTSYLKQSFLIFQLLFWLLLVSSCSNEEKVDSLAIGTGGPGGNYQMAGLAISRIVNKKEEEHGFRLQDKMSLGSVSNIDSVLAGDFEFGIAQADRQYQAVNGSAEWEGKGPQKDLRAVFSLYTESVTLVAGGDTDIRTVRDLRGKRVDIGLPGSGTRQNAIDTLEAAGIEWKEDLKLHEEKLDARLKMLMHSELDAFFYTVGHPSKDILFATSSVRGARFIPLGDIKQVLSNNPYYSESVIPIEPYPDADNKVDVDTIGVKATLVTSSKVPDDIVYAVTKAVFEDLDSLGAFDPVLKTFSKANMLEGLTAPIHPGALKYYKEIGLQGP